MDFLLSELVDAGVYKHVAMSRAAYITTDQFLPIQSARLPLTIVPAAVARGHGRCRFASCRNVPTAKVERNNGLTFASNPGLGPERSGPSRGGKRVPAKGPDRKSVV